eukprot:Pgem_evm1s17183
MSVCTCKAKKSNDKCQCYLPPTYWMDCEKSDKTHHRAELEKDIVAQRKRSKLDHNNNNIQ